MIQAWVGLWVLRPSPNQLASFWRVALKLGCCWGEGGERSVLVSWSQSQIGLRAVTTQYFLAESKKAKAKEREPEDAQLSEGPTTKTQSSLYPAPLPLGETQFVLRELLPVWGYI